MSLKKIILRKFGKKKINFDMKDYSTFLNEFYKGKNNTIGFKDTMETESFIVEFIVATNGSQEEVVDETIDKYFNRVFEDFSKSLDIFTTEELNNFNIKMEKEHNKVFDDVFNVEVKFDAYSQSEIYSMLDGLNKELNKSFETVLIKTMVNGKNFDEKNVIPKAKKQIGF